MKFSVVIPTYNRRELVLQAVQSIVRQTLPAHEIIVVVDGSTDGTAQFLRSAHPDVRLLEYKNRGLAVSRNQGTAAATGDWVAFLDDDDLWHPAKLQRMAEYVDRNPECDAMLCPPWYFTTDPTGPASHLGLARDFTADTLDCCVTQADLRGLVDLAESQRLGRATASMSSILLRNQGLYISSATVRRDVLIAAGGSCPMYVQGEDWTVLLNVARLTKWHVLPEKLVFSRFHSSQMSAGGPRTWLESLGGTVGMWYAGRPLLERLDPRDLYQAMVAVSPEYRRTVQGFLWGSLRRGDFINAARIRAAGRLLLPRLRDRLYTLIPPQLTWRWERYVLGRHRGSRPRVAVVEGAEDNAATLNRVTRAEVRS